MEQLAAQWPMLAVLVAFAGGLLKVIQALYERMMTMYKDQITELREDRDRYREIAFSTTHLAEGAVGELEKRRPL